MDWRIHVTEVELVGRQLSSTDNNITVLHFIYSNFHFLVTFYLIFNYFVLLVTVLYSAIGRFFCNWLLKCF